MKRKTTLSAALPLLALALLTTQNIQAQLVVNDDCENAIHIDNAFQYCSPANGETNFNATESPELAPFCFNAAFNDVWYSFEATSPNMEILVAGSIFSSLFGPAIALYSGTCGALSQIGCAGIIQPGVYQELSAVNLQVGQTYYIRIAAIASGTFQLCVYDASFGDEITGDCPTAVIVCDKGQRNVPFVAGPGNNPSEWSDATCLTGFPGESNTSWFVFTAATDGTLEFTLTPVDPDDDIDFVVYHLPNGAGNCNGKILERCEVAGNFGAGNPCTGPTGLNATSTDISEPPGCPPGNDNFLKYMDLLAGESYVLSVNNFTSSGAGFTIDWGGTVTFEGPNVGFKSDDADNIICIGEEIIFTDTSNYAGGLIDAWQWNFGTNATPYSDTTKGPHTVQYLNKGLKTINLNIHTNMGCNVQRSLTIQVDSCCALMASVDLQPDCLPDTSCQKALAVVNNAIGSIEYMWSTGETDSIANMLQGGDYSLIVQDAFGCVDTVDFTVKLLRTFEIPNAFTPNGDQANDVFQPVIKGAAAEVLELKIWNRWGKLVHDGTNNGWDGKIKGDPAPSDVYIYVIKIRWPDGRDEVRKGDVTLLR